MADHSLLRTFKFEQPLFATKSPWRQQLVKDGKQVVPAMPESELQCYSVFEILREGSVVAACRELINQRDLSKFAELFGQFDRGRHLQRPVLDFTAYTFPIFEAEPPTAGTREIVLRQYSGERGFPPTTLPYTVQGQDYRVAGLPVPKTAVRPSDPADSDSDGALILVDSDRLKAFDFWQTTFKDAAGNRGQGGKVGCDVVEAGTVAFFDVGSSGLGAQTPEAQRKISARASGLPYLGGLLIPEDLEWLKVGPESDPGKVAVQHALAFTLPRARFLRGRFVSTNLPADYVYPASSSERHFGTANPYALCAGQRIRLKDAIVDRAAKPVDESALKPITRIFLNTLREYGAYLVDGAPSFGFAAEDVQTAPLALKDDDQLEWLITTPGTKKLASGSDKTAWERVLTELENELYSVGVQFAVPRPDARDDELLALNFEVVANPRVLQT
jgi:hypothetical protein